MKKKICMVGDFAVGKTSLTQKFVNNVFSEKYLTTIGVKIDVAEVDETKLVIWDVAGRDSLSPLNVNYLVGAAGYVLVADGTRPNTIGALDLLKSTVVERIGEVPFVIALNKADDTANWSVTESDLKRLSNNGWKVVETSAKEGLNVEAMFKMLVEQINA